MTTVASPRLVSLMGRLLRGGGKPAGESRLRLGPTGGGQAAFGCLSARRGPPPVGRTGSPSWMTSGSTWQQCRAGRVMATRTAHCARRAPGFGGGRLYCSHAPSHRRYVDADFEGTILTALWEPASWSRPSRGWLLGAGPPAAFFMRAKVGLPSDSRPGRQPARGRRPHVLDS